MHTLNSMKIREEAVPQTLGTNKLLKKHIKIQGSLAIKIRCTYKLILLIRIRLVHKAKDQSLETKVHIVESREVVSSRKKKKLSLT